MKIKDLKEYLEDIIIDLEENYDDEEEVVVVDNTYWLKGGYRFITTKKGFVDLDFPTNREDEEEDF